MDGTSSVPVTSSALSDGHKPLRCVQQQTTSCIVQSAAFGANALLLNSSAASDAASSLSVHYASVPKTPLGKCAAHCHSAVSMLLKPAILVWFQSCAQQPSLTGSATCSVLCLACGLMNTFQLTFGCIDWRVAKAFSSQATAGVSSPHSMSAFKRACTAAWVPITQSMLQSTKQSMSAYRNH